MEAPVIEAHALFGNRLRIRACGVYIREERVLLVNHALYGGESSFWSPPGGGIEFGESAVDTLKREFEEETGLFVEVGDMLFVNEFIDPPFHAVEIFFEIVSAKGALLTGYDPEMVADAQIIHDVRFLSMDELRKIPSHERHGFLREITSFDDIFKLKGKGFLKQG